jgi:hypothetical protein
MPTGQLLSEVDPQSQKILREESISHNLEALKELTTTNQLSDRKIQKSNNSKTPSIST